MRKPVVCKYIITGINNKDYIIGWEIVPLNKWPEYKNIEMPSKEMNEIGGLIDEHGKWKYVLVGNSPVIDYQILTAGELEAEKQAEIKQKITEQLPDILFNLTSTEGFEKVKEKIAEIKTSVEVKK